MIAAYQKKILSLLAERRPGITICPSEVLEGAAKQDKIKMEKVREAARLLVQAGKIEITQKGHVVDPDTIHGPIRLRLAKQKKS